MDCKGCKGWCLLHILLTGWIGYCSVLYNCSIIGLFFAPQFPRRFHHFCGAGQGTPSPQCGAGRGTPPSPRGGRSSLNVTSVLYLFDYKDVTTVLYLLVKDLDLCCSGFQTHTCEFLDGDMDVFENLYTVLGIFNCCFQLSVKKKENIAEQR